MRHSLSPAIHNAAFRALGLDWVFLSFEVPQGEAVVAVAGARALGIDGLSVTMPHKAAVVPALDALSPVARALGAVNTVVRRPDGALLGDNTDGIGFLDTLRDDEGFDPAGRRCLVLGAGGAARAVIRALGEAGAAAVIVVNRTRHRADAAAALGGAAGRVGMSREAGDCELVVNATPVGMLSSAAAGAGQQSGRRGVLLVDPADLGPGQLLVDLVTHPAVTPLVEMARSRGAAATGGLGMLVHQAARAFRLWTGEDPPLAVMSAAAVVDSNRGAG